MTSQLLFGECVSIVGGEIVGVSWVEVRCHFDHHQGWVDFNQLTQETPQGEVAYCLDLVETIFSDKRSTWIGMGSQLPAYDGMISNVGGAKFRFSGQAIQSSILKPTKEILEKIARRLLNVPYLHGGRTVMGIDAPGLCQLVYKCNGIHLPRGAQAQSDLGATIDFAHLAEVGDLAFFNLQSEQLTHVGIVLSDQHIIHATSCVRIDKLDHYGIYSADLQQYTHRLKVIKRLF